MDRDKDAKLTYEEFVEGSKQDPTIVQVRFFASREVRRLITICRRFPCMMDWCSDKVSRRRVSLVHSRGGVSCCPTPIFCQLCTSPSYLIVFAPSTMYHT
jgi:hypothetical protein